MAPTMRLPGLPGLIPHSNPRMTGWTQRASSQLPSELTQYSTLYRGFITFRNPEEKRFVKTLIPCRRLSGSLRKDKVTKSNLEIGIAKRRAAANELGGIIVTRLIPTGSLFKIYFNGKTMSGNAEQCLQFVDTISDRKIRYSIVKKLSSVFQISVAKCKSDTKKIKEMLCRLETEGSPVPFRKSNNEAGNGSESEVWATRWLQQEFTARHSLSALWTEDPWGKKLLEERFNGKSEYRLDKRKTLYGISKLAAEFSVNDVINLINHQTIERHRRRRGVKMQATMIGKATTPADVISAVKVMNEYQAKDGRRAEKAKITPVSQKELQDFNLYIGASGFIAGLQEKQWKIEGVPALVFSQ